MESSRYTYISCPKGGGKSETCWCMLPVCDGNHSTTMVSNLTDAARIGNVKTMKYLLDRGKNANGSDVSVRTPLIWALQGGHVKATELLLERNADVNLRSLAGGGWSVFLNIYNHQPAVHAKTL
eukprot:TRINITY_DN14732_c0_g1_i1.p1 TRINITY_DN14732_c0_g1~~TRINITY_DN14732_c0_g1_i1.p1  ORF type:complete len:124 (+),score=6.11 TRINITY_DN14732_c0_g1_i1:139-510(+)